MKLNKNTQTTAMILAGGLMFAGNVGAATVLLTEDFEAAGPGAWLGGSFSQYGTGSNYSGSPHSGVTDGGESYGWAPNGSNSFIYQVVNLAPAQTEINFDGWLASYTANSEYTSFTAEFFDAAAGGGNSLGTATLADGSAFDAFGGVTEYVDGSGALIAGDAGSNIKNWSHYVTSNAIPDGALSVQINYNGVGGNDAYADNIAVSTVPEPSSAALLGLGGLALILRRRK